MRKIIKPSVRVIVLEKYGGRCAYCGIKFDKMHIDHVVPVSMGGGNEIDNLMPSCQSCNNYKMNFHLERFRDELQSQVMRARQYSLNFRLAERFGLVQEIKKKVLFYYEGGVNDSL